MAADIPEELKKAVERLKRDDDVQTMDLRLYIKEGRVQVIEPLDKEKYKVEFLANLNGQEIREVTGVAISQESPVCLYWLTYYNPLSGQWEKICLKWSS